MKTVIFVPSNENHVEIFWSICRHIESCRPVFISQDSLKDEGAEKAMRRLGIEFSRLEDYSNDPAVALRKEEASALVVANDTDVVPQWFVNCAKEMEIPAVLVQDGILFDFTTINSWLAVIHLSRLKLLLTAFRLRIQGKYRKVTYGSSGCTKILVWGQSSKSYLASKGIDEKKIVITGSTAVHVARNFKHDPDSKNVVYIPTDLAHSNIVRKDQANRIVEAACLTILSSGNVKLTVKPHPREDRAFYEHLKKKYSPALIISYENVYELISKAGFVVTDISTSAAEALAAKKSVVIFMPGIEKIVAQSSFPRDLISKQAVLYAGDEQTLRDCISGLLNGTHMPSKQAADEMAESYLGGADSNPFLLSADAIKSVLR